MSYLFPAAFVANTFAITILMVTLGMSGKSGMAAEVGIVQGASLALFYAFSANARSRILNPASMISAQSIMASRLVLLVPLAGLTYFLVTTTVGVEQFIAIALILRRCVEWLGEVHLSEMERLDDKKFALNYLILQVILLAVIFLWLVADFSFPLFGLLIWALTPLVLSVEYLRKSFLAITDALAEVSSSIMPHLGSTAIIGITVYVFRLLILLFLGKETAGDLYTAFAIGGLTGGVFANALGPSIVLHEQRSEERHFPLMFSVALYLSLVLGIVIFASATLALPVLNWTGKSFFFWKATGLSIIGGVIMVYAQRIRLRLLQQDEEHDVFGPDIMINILLIAAVPFTYYLFGTKTMAGLYLLSSLLAFVFYLSSRMGSNSDWQSHPAIEKARMAVAVGLLFPIFFQISNGIFRDSTVNYNSGGVLANLPISFSVLACYAGIILLSEYKRAFISFAAIFFTCILMMMAAIISTRYNPAQQQAKLVLLIQFILPMFALVLGQIYHSGKNCNNGNNPERMFLYVLTIIIPWHLIATFYQGFAYLSPSLGLFSIYQSFEYVPVVLVSAYLVALSALWQLLKARFLLLVLAPLMAIYAVISGSLVAVGMMFIGLLGFALLQWKSNAEKVPAFVFLLVIILSWSYIHYQQPSMLMAKLSSAPGAVERLKQKMKLQWEMQELDVETETSQEYTRQLSQNEKDLPQAITLLSRLKETEKLYKIKIPPNILERMIYWQKYLGKIVATPRGLLVGSGEIPDRVKYPSAHNYYLDFTYNFGLIALVPLLSLLTYTCALIYQRWREIYLLPNIAGLCFVTFFLLIIDNFLKVGLRQPYPGIFTFFLWGLLLNRLRNLNNAEVSLCNPRNP